MIAQLHLIAVLYERMKREGRERNKGEKKWWKLKEERDDKIGGNKGERRGEKGTVGKKLNEWERMYR